MARDTDKEPKYINRVELLGRLGRDPEIIQLHGGSTMCKMSVATDRSWKNTKTGAWETETQWHTISTFADEHIAVAERSRKGAKVYVTGMITYRKFTGRDGGERYMTEIVVKAWDQFEIREPAPSGRDGTVRTGEGRSDVGRRRDSDDSTYERRRDATREALDNDLDLDDIPF